LSYRRCKGTAILGDGEIFAGLLSEVVATGAGICDNLQESCRIVSQCGLKRKIEGIKKALH